MKDPFWVILLKGYSLKDPSRRILQGGSFKKDPSRRILLEGSPKKDPSQRILQGGSILFSYKRSCSAKDFISLKVTIMEVTSMMNLEGCPKRILFSYKLSCSANDFISLQLTIKQVTSIMKTLTEQFHLQKKGILFGRSFNKTQDKIQFEIRDLSLLLLDKPPDDYILF